MDNTKKVIRDIAKKAIVKEQDTKPKSFKKTKEWKNLCLCASEEFRLSQEEMLNNNYLQSREHWKKWLDLQERIKILEVK